LKETSINVFWKMFMLFSFFVRLTILLSLPIASLAVGASLLGGTQPIHPALRGFVEGCADTLSPCWYGVIPGQTTFEAALTLLEQRGFTPQQEDNSRDGGVRYFVFADTCVFNFTAQTYTTPILSVAGYGCSDLYLGDFITVFGTPFVKLVEIDCGGRVYMIDFPTISVDNLYFYSPVQTRINRFFIDSIASSSERIWRDFSPYGHFGRAAHRSPRRCSG
jgi:hypothetical protein